MTDDTRLLRFKTMPPIGQIVELFEPERDPSRWIVIAGSTDPAAEWGIQYEDEGDPEASPSTVLVHLRPVR